MDENQISYEEIDREIEERATDRRRRRPHEIFDFVELIVIALSVILLVTLFIFRQTIVEGGSMNNTLLDGERIVISDLLYTPKAGDIVVLQVTEEMAAKNPKLVENGAIIKRVIATEGQTVTIKGGTVFVDGIALDEKYVYRDGPDYAHTGTLTVTVSEGHLFVLGDHRNSSYDSRDFGEVDERTVIGKALFRIFPFSRIGGIS